eukprot:8402381-Ditylum_brightwellii.AAC.1
MPSPNVLLDHCFPISLVESFVASSNKYCEEREKEYPSLSCWQNRKSSSVFTLSSLYHLIAMIYYMDHVHLPSLRNYWSTDHYMPQHRVMKELGITKDFFLFTWHNFHVYNEEAMDMRAKEEAEKE